MHAKRWLKETKIVLTPRTVSNETRGWSLVPLLHEAKVSLLATLALAVVLCGIYPLSYLIDKLPGKRPQVAAA